MRYAWKTRWGWIERLFKLVIKLFFRSSSLILGVWGSTWVFYVMVLVRVKVRVRCKYPEGYLFFLNKTDEDLIIDIDWPAVDLVLLELLVVVMIVITFFPEEWDIVLKLKRSYFWEILYTRNTNTIMIMSVSISIYKTQQASIITEDTGGIIIPLGTIGL